MRRLLALAAGLAALPLPAQADPCTAPLPKCGEPFSGPVRYVGDGDSLCVGATAEPSTWVEVRLADFYAPELHAPGGQQAKAALEAITRGRSAQCLAHHRSYDRIVAACSIDGADVGDLMRGAGVLEGGNGKARPGG